MVWFNLCIKHENGRHQGAKNEKWEKETILNVHLIVQLCDKGTTYL